MAVGRRWRSATAIGLVLGVAAAVGVWYFYPPLYTASAVVMASYPESSPLDPTRRPDRDEVEGFQRNQLAMIRNGNAIREALRRPEVRDTQTVRSAADPASLIGRRLQVGYQDGTDLLRFSMSDVRPDDLAPILNAVKEAYLKEAREIQKKHLDVRVAEIGSLVSNSEGRLLALRDATRRLSGPTPTTAEVTRYEAIVREHARVQSDLRRAEGTVLLYKERVVSVAKYTPPESLIDEAVAVDPMVAGQLTLIADLEAALKERAKRAVENPNDRKTAELTAELTAAQKARDEAMTAAKERSATILRKKAKEIAEQNLAIAEENVEILKRGVAELRKEMEETVPKVRSGDEIDQKRLEITQAEDALRGLRAVQERLFVESLTTPRNLGVIAGGDAEAPSEPDRASHVRRIAGAGVGTFLLGVLLVGGWEMLTQRLTTREDVARAIGLRVVGDLPQIVRPGWFGPSSASSAAGFTTALNTLRAVLLLGNSKDSRVILVTSAEPGEGKTTLAYNLACAMARAGVRTLLVDGDLLRPRLHLSFGVPVAPGLGEVITGDMPLGPLGVATHRTDVPGLCFLPAGNGGPAASDGLHGERANNLFQAFRVFWELIVIDGPPVLAAAEPLLLGRHADAALLAIRSGVSVAPQVREACRQLADAEVPVLGAVLTGTPNRTNGYYGYRPAAPTVPLVTGPESADPVEDEPCE